MNRYISEIKINKLFHLQNLSIQIADEKSPHLILTGMNGSGKTVLLNAIADFLDKIKNDTNFFFLQYPKWIKSYKERVAQNPKGSQKYIEAVAALKNTQKQYDSLYGKINISFTDGYSFINDYQEGDFIIAFYQAARKTDIIEPKNPTKPILTVRGDAKKNLTSQLLNFLSDLKIQEALARNEGKTEDADYIRRWLEGFVNILRDLFDDRSLALEFNYRDYSFHIVTKGKSFKFTELSDGFVAALDIVADLILKMQPDGGVSSKFNKPGIVMIDEVETHLHLQLQKTVLPMLTTLFPNIQFIVSTHSPFVLSSLSNATAYDLEHHEPITNLTEYSYQALTEGYFGVSTDSDYARQRYNELETLLKKETLSDNELVIARQIFEDYKKIPEAISPELVGAYRQLEIKYNNKIREFLEE